MNTYTAATVALGYRVGGSSPAPSCLMLGEPFLLGGQAGKKCPGVKTCSIRRETLAAVGVNVCHRKGAAEMEVEGESLVLLPAPPVPLGSAAFSLSRVAGLNFIFKNVLICMDSEYHRVSPKRQIQ